MRIITLLLVSVLFSIKLPGQNLVLNPSFEENLGCPGGFDNWIAGSIDSTLDWTQPYYSSDYFHPCSPGGSHGTPVNGKGFQVPRSGIAYAGIVGFSFGNGDSAPYYREYLQGTFSEPLIKDSVYLVEFFVCLAEQPTSSGAAASDMIGAYLSEELTQYNINYPTPHDLLPFKPQINSPKGDILTDSINWTRICGYFRAAGGESYITIGNFFPNNELSYIPIGNNEYSSSSYYYLDDVSVSPSTVNPYQWTQHKTICTQDSTSAYTLPDSFTDIQWSTGDSLHTVSIKGSGAFWVQADLDGCAFSDTFSIEYLPAPAVGFPEDTTTVCNTGLPLQLETGDCCSEVLWSTGDTTHGVEIDQDGLVWVHLQNLCGEARDSFWLQIDEPLAPDLGADTVLCDTVAFARVLSGPAGLTDYFWSTGANTPSITITQPGTYWLEVGNACGIFTDTVVLKDLRAVRLETGKDTTLCLTAPLRLWASPGFGAYRWSTGETSEQVWVNDYGHFTVAATNECGTQTDTIAVVEANHPVIDLPAAIAIGLGDSIRLEPEVYHDKPLAFQWSPQAGLSCTYCESPLATPWATTDFLLVVEDSLGCREEAVVRVSVAERLRVYVPNVFSPGGSDVQNDRLTVSFGPEVDQVLSAAIYDRWGGLVLQKQNIVASSETAIWDGSINGKVAQPGVFVLVMEIRMLNGKSVTIAQDVTLVR